MGESRSREANTRPTGAPPDAAPRIGCPHCGEPVQPHADFCESCRTWLKPGCVFCGAATRPSDDLCSACGEPWAGIECGDCGTHSLFDCCPGCGAALTARAELLVAEISEDRSVADLLELAKASVDEPVVADPSPPPPVDPHAKARAARDAVRRNLNAQASVPAPAVPAAPVARGPSADELLEGAGMTRQAVKAMVDRQEAQVRLAAALEALQGRSFASAQEARAYFDALRLTIMVAVPKLRIIGWRCHAFGCTHSDGPSGCADPSQGGTWITEHAGIEMIAREVDLD